MNALDMKDLLRDQVGEATAAHWSELNLLRRLNVAQDRVAKVIAMNPGQWLIVSTTLTPSDSVLTLPADCAKPVYMEGATSGRPISWLGSVTHRRVSRAAGTSLDTLGAREAYPLIGTIEINQDSFSENVKLWYQIRVPKLHFGYAVAGGASSLTFDTSVTESTSDAGTGRELVYLADYYKNVVVEVVDGTSGIVDIRSTISASTAAGVMTITGTPAADDLYGTVSRLPEEAHPLIVAEATVLAMMKPSANLDAVVYQHYRDELKVMRKEVYEWLESRIPGGDVVQTGDVL